jgi:hypothetical protein
MLRNQDDRRAGSPRHHRQSVLGQHHHRAQIDLMTRSKVAVSSGSAEAPLMPALDTRMSMPPNRSSFPRPAATAASSATSQTIPVAPSRSRRGGRRIGILAGYDDARVMRDERLGDGKPQATARSRHQRDFARQVE